MNLYSWSEMSKKFKSVEGVMFLLSLSFFSLAGHSYLSKVESATVVETTQESALAPAVTLVNEGVGYVQHGQFEPAQLKPLNEQQVDEMTQKLKAIKKKISTKIKL